MVSLSNHEGLARAVVRRFMVRPGKTRSVCACAHHEAISQLSVRLKDLAALALRVPREGGPAKPSKQKSRQAQSCGNTAASCCGQRRTAPRRRYLVLRHNDNA